MEVDGLFVVAYGVMICEVDFNVEVDGVFVGAYGMVVCAVAINVG